LDGSEYVLVDFLTLALQRSFRGAPLLILVERCAVLTSLYFSAAFGH
jgi:hypothetical protein